MKIKKLKRLTEKQHFHAAFAIRKFNNNSKLVEVKNIATGEIDAFSSRAKVFSTKRTWDERAEHGYMADIENKFLAQLDDIKPFDKRNHQDISRYFILWGLRHDYHVLPKTDVFLFKISSNSLSPQQQVDIEKKHGSYIDNNGFVPSRFNNSIKIQAMIDFYMQQMEGFKWGLLESVDGEFLVADSYKTKAFMPIGPKKAFAVGVEDENIDNIAEFNIFSMSEATNFTFARDFTQCPLA